MLGWAIPVRIEVSATMPGSAEAVWDLITDWEHQDDWQLEAEEFKVIGSQRQGVGTVAEASVRIAGITVRDRVRVSGWEPCSLLAIDHDGWVKGKGVLRLSGLTSGETRIDWTEELSAPVLGPLGSFGLWLLRPVMRRVFRRDLGVLAGLVRARSPN